MNIVLYGAPVMSFSSRLQGLLGDAFELRLVDYDADDREMAKAFDGSQAVVTVRFDARIPHDNVLELVQVPGVGCDEINVDLLPEGSALCNVNGHGEAVAEYVLLAMLQWCIRFAEANDSFRAGSWLRSSRFQASPHRELAGSTVGIVGYGLIGQSIAERLQGFNVRNLVCCRTEPKHHRLYHTWYALKELPAMVADCDFLVIALPLTSSTRNLVDENIFNKMKRDAVLINVARGPIVNESDLFAALQGRHIGGAVIDVWFKYPVSANDQNAKPSIFDFSSLDNVYMTPHISGWTNGTVNRRWSAIAENLRRLSKGEALLNIVEHKGLAS